MLALHDALGSRGNPHAAPSQSAPLNSLSPLGSWLPLQPLQHGDLVHVYRARPSDSPEAGRADYVLKFVPPGQPDSTLGKALLQREAFVSRLVSHPHLTTVLAAQTDRPPYFLVLPFFGGVSVRKLLLKQRRLPTPQALWIVRQATEALRALHAAGWLHADVKPSNLMFSPRGHTTLIDLGFARRISAKPSPTTLMTSLAYASPELIQQADGLEGRSDVYSLGVTLFELLTGQRPFCDDDPATLAQAHLTQSPPEARSLVPQLSPRVGRLLRDMLEKEPAWRPGVEELLGRLLDLEIETFDERVAA